MITIRRLIGVGLVALGVYCALQIESGGLLFLGMFLLVIGLWMVLGSLAAFGGGGGSVGWFGGGGSDDSDR